MYESKETFLTFLKETKDGKYAPVDTQSEQYARIKEQTIDLPEDVWLYGIR